MRRRAQKIGRVENGRRLHRARQARRGIGEPAAAQLADADVLRQQHLGRRAPQGDQDFRVDQLDEALHEGHADGHFHGRRIAVSRRPPEHGVGNVDLRPVQPDGPQHAVEKPSADADEGQALAVFLGARRLADEDDAGLRIAVPEDQVGGRLFQPAAVEPLQGTAQFLHRHRRRGQGPGAVQRLIRRGRFRRHARGCGGWGGRGVFHAVHRRRRGRRTPCGGGGRPDCRRVQVAVHRRIADGLVDAGLQVPLEKFTRGKRLGHEPTLAIRPTVVMGRPGGGDNSVQGHPGCAI